MADTQSETLPAADGADDVLPRCGALVLAALIANNGITGIELEPQSETLFLRYDPRAKKWTESNRVHARLGVLQPAPVEIDPSTLIAYARRGGGYEKGTEGYVVRTESHDGGKTWTEGTETKMPNPNAAVDFLRLRNGHLLLVYNNSLTDRSPLTVAISTDNDKTYAHQLNIAEGRNDFAYPYAIQTRDGKIHIVYTSDRRSVINHAVFDEGAVR